MHCPKCRGEIDFSRPDCSGCGADLLEAFEERARTGEQAAQASTSQPSSSSFRPLGRGWAVALCLLGLAAAGAAWIGRYETRAMAAQRFSYDPPLGWLVEEPDIEGRPWAELLRFSQAPATLQVLAGGHHPFSVRTAAAFAEESFQASEIRVERTHDLTVGGRPAWGIVVSGKRRSGRFSGHAIVVPGARTHLIQLSSEPADFARRNAELQRFLGGVRFE